MEFREVFVRFQERLLQDIFGVFPVLRDVLSQPENIALIAFGQPVESFSIALASLGYQSAFIENSGFVWQVFILASCGSKPCEPAERLSSMRGIR